MKDGIAELIVKENWPMMKVTSGAYTDEIEASTLTNVRKNIEPYGVEIIRFGDFSITMDQADKDRLDKLVERMAYVNASGGMAGYQQLAQAEMMMGAAEGMFCPASAGAAASRSSERRSATDCTDNAPTLTNPPRIAERYLPLNRAASTATI